MLFQPWKLPFNRFQLIPCSKLQFFTAFTDRIHRKSYLFLKTNIYSADLENFIWSSYNLFKNTKTETSKLLRSLFKIKKFQPVIVLLLSRNINRSLFYSSVAYRIFDWIWIWWRQKIFQLPSNHLIKIMSGQEIVASLQIVSENPKNLYFCNYTKLSTT